MVSAGDEKQIAEWMLDQYNLYQRLSQLAAVRGIPIKFGDDDYYKNKQKNWAINKGILEKFRAFTPDDVVWSRSSQSWRVRLPYNPKNTRMVREHSDSFQPITP